MEKENNSNKYRWVLDCDGETPPMCGGSVEYGSHCSSCKHATPEGPCKNHKECYLYKSYGE